MCVTHTEPHEDHALPHTVLLLIWLDVILPTVEREFVWDVKETHCNIVRSVRLFVVSLRHFVTFTLRRMITLAVLDVRMHLTPSLTTMCVPDCTTSFFLETRHDGATKKLPVTRLDLPGVPAKPSIWHCGFGLP